MKYDLCIVGLNGVTAYILASLRHLFSDILIVTSLDIDSEYTWCTIHDLVPHSQILDIGLDKVTTLKKCDVDAMPNVEIMRVKTLEDVKVEVREDFNIVRIESRELPCRYCVVSSEASSNDNRGTILDIDILEKVKRVDVVELDVADPLRAVELALLIQNVQYCTEVSFTGKGVKKVHEELADTLLQTSKVVTSLIEKLKGCPSSTNVVSISTKISYKSPKVMHQARRGGVLDYRKNVGDRIIQDYAILIHYASSIASCCQASRTILQNTRLILSPSLTYFRLGEGKKALESKIERGVSTTRSTVYLLGSSISCRLYYHGSRIFTVELLCESSRVESLVLTESMFLKLCSNILRQAVTAPFYFTSILGEPIINPEWTCLQNVLKEGCVHKIFKLE